MRVGEYGYLYDRFVLYRIAMLRMVILVIASARVWFTRTTWHGSPCALKYGLLKWLYCLLHVILPL